MTDGCVNFRKLVADEHRWPGNELETVRKTYLLIVKRKFNILSHYSIAAIKMSGRQAKVLSDQQIEDLLVYTSTTRNPERNRVIVLLSIKAGLRAGEIGKLTWDMVLDPTGEVGTLIELGHVRDRRRR